MKKTLITRTFKNSDGIQQIAIFDTTQGIIGAELGLFIDNKGREQIEIKKENNILIAKLVFLGLVQ
jgi:hypothetical protein